MAPFTTYGASANARDVSDYVTIVSPKDSPFFSMISSNKGSARLKENVTDALTAASASNALIEGGSFTDDTLTARAFESNYMQIFSKTINVSGTQEEVAKFGGVTSEISLQVKKKFTELATDVEITLIQGTSASGTTAAARKMSGILQKITTNTATAASTGATWTGTSAANLTAFEELFNDMLQLGFTTGQTFDTIFVGANRKRRLSKLTTNVARNIAAEEKTQINSINLYDSDFGSVNIILDRYVQDQYILAVNLDSWQISYLRRFMKTPLAKTTDSERMAIVGELTLDGRTEKAAGKITAS